MTKTFSFRGLKVCLAGIFAMAAFGLGHIPARGAGEDINALFQMGKAAYYKGDLEIAQQLLSQVAARDPKHFETKALLAQISTQMKPNTSSLKRQYQSVTLPKVEFADVTLQEALDALRMLSKAKTEGKIIPNFLIKDPALAAKPVQINLSNVPMTEIIQYLAQMTGARVTYDQHAVVFAGLTQ